MTIQPMPCAQPKTATTSVPARTTPAQQQHEVDRRVREREVLAAVADRSASLTAEQRGHPPQRAGRPRRARRRGRRGHQACVVVLVRRASTSAPSAQPRLADQHHQPVGQARPAPRPRAARARPTTPPRARASSVSTGSSPTSTAPPAPSAQRPAHVATQAARRPASQRPSASRTTHSTDSEPRGVLAHQPQRPAHRLQLELEPAVAGLEVGQPRGQPVVRRASRGPCERGDRLVGGRALRRGRLERLLAPAARHLVRPARGRGRGCRVRRTLRPVSVDVATAPQALGLGLRGRAAGPTSCARPRRARRAPRLRLAEPEPPVPLADVELPAPRARRRRLRRAATPARAPRTRTARSYRDVVRALPRAIRAPARRRRPPARRGRARARARRGAASASVAVIPFGGGTSVVGGVDAALGRATTGVVALDLGGSTACSRSTASRAPRASRPARPARGSRSSSREHGLTLRHFPQSFEFSTLGGWIATRAGGHFATGPTHIDDLVESVRALTPAATCGSRGGCPARAPGPSPDRHAARLRGHARRDHRGVGARAARARASARSARACASPTSPPAREAVRAIVAVGPAPANCRLIDAARGAR